MDCSILGIKCGAVPTADEKRCSANTILSTKSYVLAKLVLMKIKLGAPRLGLGKEQYAEIAANAQVVV